MSVNRFTGGRGEAKIELKSALGKCRSLELLGSTPGLW